jgi:hypothetical protein
VDGALSTVPGCPDETPPPALGPEGLDIVVEQSDHLGPMSTDLVEAALSASGRRLVVM